MRVVHIAPSQEAAEEIKARLEAEGLLVVLRAVERGKANERSYYELLVPQAEAEEALEILNAPNQR